MGERGSDGSTMGFLPRLLIIGFGVGIVALGLEPIRSRYGSFWNYIKQETTALAGESGLAHNAWNKVRGVGAAVERKVEAAQARKPQTKVAEQEKQVDQLSDSDRKKLDNLVNDLK